MERKTTTQTRYGYPIDSGYVGYITEDGDKILFTTEEEYNEYWTLFSFREIYMLLYGNTMIS